MMQRNYRLEISAQFMASVIASGQAFDDYRRVRLGALEELNLFALLQADQLIEAEKSTRAICGHSEVVPNGK